MTTYKSLNVMEPQYLKELHKHYKPNRMLRSSKNNQLVVKNTNTKTHENRAYEHAATEIWNKLSSDIRLSKQYSSKNISKV